MRSPHISKTVSIAAMCRQATLAFTETPNGRMLTLNLVRRGVVASVARQSRFRRTLLFMMLLDSSTEQQCVGHR